MYKLMVVVILVLGLLVVGCDDDTNTNVVQTGNNNNATTNQPSFPDHIGKIIGEAPTTDGWHACYNVLQRNIWGREIASKYICSRTMSFSIGDCVALDTANISITGKVSCNMVGL